MAKYKVVITDHEYKSIENERRILEPLGVDLQDYQYKDTENILRVAKDADAIIVQYAKMPRELVEQLDHCRIIARYATGFDGIDLDACTDKGIYFCNVSDYCREEVSTHTLALLLEMARRVSRYNEMVFHARHSAQPQKPGHRCHQFRKNCQELYRQSKAPL